MNTKKFSVTAALLTAAILTACGSSNDDKFEVGKYNTGSIEGCTAAANIYMNEFNRNQWRSDGYTGSHSTKSSYPVLMNHERHTLVVLLESGLTTGRGPHNIRDLEQVEYLIDNLSDHAFGIGGNYNLVSLTNDCMSKFGVKG